MKMIVAILQNEDAENVSQALINADYCVTEIASTGGFLRQGSSTLMVGAEDESVDDAILLINNNCTPSVEPLRKRATLFVLNVEHFEQR
jgi:uncharacterized protein YaaQ